LSFLITVALTFALIVLALLVFRYVGLPVYRVEVINIKVLLESVLDETASTADWDVFIGMPIRHDPELDKIRLQCAMLAKTTMIERAGMVIFSEQGRSQLAAIVELLNAQIAAMEHRHD